MNPQEFAKYNDGKKTPINLNLPVKLVETADKKNPYDSRTKLIQVLLTKYLMGEIETKEVV